MFTGIVREVGRVEAVEERGESVRLVVRAPETAAARSRRRLGLARGGVPDRGRGRERSVAFDAVPETLRRSTLGRLETGGGVNVEPALRAGDPLGGHIVQGHVDGVGRIRRVDDEGIEVEAPQDVLRYCVEKGSIAVEGVSLTIAGLGESSFTVALIPHTREVTTLGERRRRRRRESRGGRGREVRREARSAVRLEPLYRINFAYPEHYLSRGPDTLGLFFGEGRVEGQVTGRFRGLNHARLRSDDVYVPDFHGVIETDDGALLAFHLQGLARKSKYGREVTGTIVHNTGSERYARLNDAICVLAGEARRNDIRLEVAELVWEPSALSVTI